MDDIPTNLPPDEFRRRVRMVAGMIAGTAPDPLNIGYGFRLRIAVAFLEKVKLAFIVKSRGGTDDAGISWPKLSPQYLAYGRGPFSSRRAGKSAPGLVRGGDRDGQQKDGFMTKAQLKRWRRDFAQALKWLVLFVPIDEAKGRAAKIAWANAKAAGVRTKLDVFGSRDVDILRDRGELFNSLSPGILVPAGLGVRYEPPNADQVLTESGGVQRVGTNVAHAGAHHNPKRKGFPQRRLWPESLPDSWASYLIRQASSGLSAALRIWLAGGAN